MEAVGLLAGGIAHDFNNLLTGILGYSDMLMRKISEDSPFQHYLEEIHKAGKRAASLTSQLLAFSRKQILEAKVLKLNDLIQDMNKMLGRIIREDIHLQYFFGSALPCIKADPVQIEQIIMNLVLNARDAIPKKGEITIRTQTAQFDKITRFMHDEIKPGRYVELSVEDDGEGMSPEVMSQIFEPFFTTKEVGRGTGLGLSTVFGIVKQSGGAIQFQSTPGEGTRVSIYFPMVNEEPLPRIREAESSHTQGEEVIFLVEDEEFVRQMVQRILEEYGYTVLAAANYSEVEQQLAHDPGAIDLLLTDVILPQKNGREIAELVVARYPDTKVLYMSGHTEDEILRQGIFTSEVNFIHKPFSPLFLLQRIRTLLHPTRNF
jgi:CheY-like chemotaxis protein